MLAHVRIANVEECAHTAKKKKKILLQYVKMGHYGIIACL